MVNIQPFLKQLSDLAAFFHKTRHRYEPIIQKKGVIGWGTKAETIGKELNIGVPELIKGAWISTANAPDKRFTNKMVLSVKDKGDNPGVIDRTKTYCYMACGDVLFNGFRCIMVCVTCTDEWGGGCGITVYY